MVKIISFCKKNTKTTGFRGVLESKPSFVLYCRNKLTRCFSVCSRMCSYPPIFLRRLITLLLDVAVIPLNLSIVRAFEHSTNDPILRIELPVDAEPTVHWGIFTVCYAIITIVVFMQVSSNVSLPEVPRGTQFCHHS